MSALVLLSAAIAAQLTTPDADPVLAQAAAASMPALTRCGEEATGRLSASMIVTDGAVTGVQLVESSLQPAEQRCVLGSLFGWRFPAETSEVFPISLDLAALPPMSAAHIETVGRVVQAGAGQLRRCYEQALHTDPTLTLALDATLGIVAGQVAHLVLTTGPDRNMHDCLERRLRSWQFPSGVSGEVVLPLSFVPSATG